MGITNTIATIPGFLAPIITDTITTARPPPPPGPSHCPVHTSRPGRVSADPGSQKELLLDQVGVRRSRCSTACASSSLLIGGLVLALQLCPVAHGVLHCRGCLRCGLCRLSSRRKRKQAALGKA
jgi:hypothetical protein